MQREKETMAHPDEHTLELYILAAVEIGVGKRREIDRHLKSCRRCKALHDHLRAFYDEFSSEIRQNHQLGQRVSTTPALRNVEYLDVLTNGDLSRSSEPFTRIERFQRFVARNAVPASIGGFAVVGLLLFVIISGRIRTGNATAIADTNPQYVLLNGTDRDIEVYNRSNQRLWSVPCISAADAFRSDRIRNMHSVIVTDLDGDGKNEVVSLLPMPGSYDSHEVIIYSTDGHITIRVQLPADSVVFRQNIYQSKFSPGAVVALRRPTGGHELFIAWGNGRSPSLITRVGKDGVIAGEYWHYGNFMAMYALVGKDSTDDRLVCIGCDDIAEQDGVNRQYVESLNPWKITGKSECTWNRGFGFPPSDAEIHAIVFDHRDLERATHRPIYLAKLISTKEDVLRFSFDSGPDLQDPPSLEYVFSRDFQLLDIKNEDATVRMIEKLHKEGKADFLMDSAYHDKLKNRILYWDGRHWQHKSRRVAHFG